MPKSDGKTPQQRFDKRYAIDPVTNCWNWTAGLNSKGYAYIFAGGGHNGPSLQAYKLAWIWKNGPVPAGKQLHHTCENTRCVNPDHVEPLTRKEHFAKHPEAENKMRNTLAAIRAARKVKVDYSL